MYYLANGNLNPGKIHSQSELSGYIVATIKNGFGYQICLIDAKTKTLLKSSFRFDLKEALPIAEKTFNVLIKETFPVIS